MTMETPGVSVPSCALRESAAQLFDILDMDGSGTLDGRPLSQVGDGKSWHGLNHRKTIENHRKMVV